MYCRATGSPTPKLSWLKNGGLLPAQVSPALHCVRARCCGCPAASAESHHAVEMRMLTISLLFVSSPCDSVLTV